MLAEETNLKTVWIDKAALKAAGINEESLKARVAVREQHQRKQLALRQSNSLLRRERAAKERKLAEKFLLPTLTQAGYNAREIETLCKHEREQARRAFEQQKAVLASDPPFNVNALRTQRATLRQAHNAALPNFNFNFVVLDTPAFVYPSGDMSIVDSIHVTPGNSFVRCSGEWSYRDSGSVNFLFLWTNETSRPATLNVESLMTVRGSAVAYAGGGEFFGNDVAFIPYVQLYPYYLDNTPPLPVSS